MAARGFGTSQERSAEALVLRRSDSGENDRRLTLLTYEFGKLDVVAKGARKGGSRLAGSSEPLTRCRFTWAEGRSRRYVTSVQPVTSYPGLRGDYSRLLAALAWVEVLGESLPVESEAPEYFELALEVLGHLEGESPAGLVLLWGLSRLLVEEGHGASWTVCVGSGSRLDRTPGAVSFESGGYVSDLGFAPGGRVRWVSAEALVGLERIVELEDPPVKMRSGREALVVVVDFWRSLLERRLPACEVALGDGGLFEARIV